ncbi:MORC family CW-type zinc finger protein 3-like [Papaver somniferum]|uniref:MORC family CW-type zinc finger protein 3-like n=1 Tax=Papaver somniferum TaxID=3469 RepID=UPI000E6FE957|nr:MORC family CW-type zinc finger protein 3-like [Papaver somniferum]XP_026389317.1 MORC family CW-type zinc finger protein 3-like [Papaver somniferum]XP_026389318.1 MORC family CW-type zinc finger protein 3-like [Papaver somniferum]XP_026389319.1 MORC family CW-type zinc finger protein 3-like [Papaver somniferum]XP_026389320.1 MORC family CW-type zinc finger protein 3-like [Papaver somniferum]
MRILLVKNLDYSVKMVQEHRYTWNLERSGNDYFLDWQSRKESDDLTEDQDILIRSRFTRSRPGHFVRSFAKVPLDYSLRSFLEVIYLNPRMKIYVQGSLVNCRPLAKSLHNTKIVNTRIKEKQVQLTLGLCGRDCIYWNCGIFLYLRGRLIEAYKRVGSMVHSGEPGLVGVIDVTDIMNDGDDAVFLESTKEAFRFCKAYKELEEWLGRKTNEYIDENYIETLHAEWCNNFKPDHELAQCDKCRKWRILNSHFDIKTLPEEWYCCMPPYSGICETPEEVVDHGISAVGGKRSRFYGPWDRNLPS